MHNTSTNEGDNRSFEQRLVFLDVDCEGWKSNDIRLTMDIKSAVFEKGGSSAMLYKRSAAARAGAFLLPPRAPPPPPVSLSYACPKHGVDFTSNLSHSSPTSESPAPPQPSCPRLSSDKCTENETVPSPVHLTDHVQASVVAGAC